MAGAEVNQFGQTLGEPVENWSMRPAPPRAILEGRYCRLEPLDLERHTADLMLAFGDDTGSNWTYLSVGPFEDLTSFRGWVTASALSADVFFALTCPASGKALGVISLMRIDRNNGVIEIGNVHFSPILKRTRVATEAIYLLLRLVFDDLGYRRCEWKCNALNEPSRRAAQRFGFTFEGVFRKAMIVKNRNRDTAWFSMLDNEWPERKAVFETWLDAANFDGAGQQKRRLSDVMARAGASG